MKRKATMSASASMSALALSFALAACGGDGDGHAPLDYTDPKGGALRLVKNGATTKTTVVLDLIVGDNPLTGYATGFNLPLAADRVKLAELTPGTALDAGSAPPAARALIPTAGPLAGMLVAAQSQKASGTGAVAVDTQLAPSSVLFTLKLELVPGAAAGIVFDGTAADFALPSGGLRDRAGNTVVDAAGVSIGKLEVFGD